MVGLSEYDPNLDILQSFRSCELRVGFKYDPRNHTKPTKNPKVRVFSCDFVDRFDQPNREATWKTPG
jgi:hypothetical protein